MKARQTTEPIAPDMVRLLRDGPWSVGLNLRTMPSHDALLALWQQHRDTILATMPRGKKPWFEERIWFVEQIRRA